MMDQEMRDRVWKRWLIVRPRDVECDEQMRDALLGTLTAESIALRFACEDFAESLVGSVTKIADALGRALARLLR